MAVTFLAIEPEPEPEPEPNGTPPPAKPVTAIAYGPNNIHPDKGIYLKVQLPAVVLDPNAYLGVASTGQLGITNIKFDFPINLGNGEVILTYHSGWGNLTIARDAAYIAKYKLVGKKSGVKVAEIPGYILDDSGKSNITDLLGPLKEKN